MERDCPEISWLTSKSLFGKYFATIMPTAVHLKIERKEVAMWWVIYKYLLIANIVMPIVYSSRDI